ncbi:adenosylcobinamide-GDP ribazoletransferase [Rhodocyclaceae bacterium SMB388]
MRYQVELFFTALAFFTRLPVPGWVPWSVERLNHAARYFPLVGWVVGAAAAVSLLLFALFLPVTLAVLLSMAVTIRLTGAFHEDGWADTCDGFGGGWDKSQTLAIMKDSRNGTYATVGLVLMLLAKAAALLALAAQDPSVAAVALLVAHPLSRLASTSLIHTMTYVREDELSKAKPLARRLDAHELALATLFGLLPLTLLAPARALLACALVAVATLLAARAFHRKLGGYTGDCLGAAQQLTELACYLALVATWNSI